MGTRFEKSSGGGIGIEFRGSSGESVGTYSNLTEPEGSILVVKIPANATKFVYSYLNEAGCVEKEVGTFDKITFYFIGESEGGIVYDVGRLEREIYGVSLSPQEITEISRKDGYFYNLLEKREVQSQYYFYSTIDIPSGATSLETRFEKSTGGGIGIEFRNGEGEEVGTYSNLTEPSGTKIKVGIPANATQFIYSYLNEAGVDYQSSEPFDGIVFYFEKGGLLRDVESLKKEVNRSYTSQIPDFGAAQLYLSEGTGNELQDSYTIDALYEEYDKLCSQYPNFIKRIEDLGTDASGSYEIRQYIVGFNNAWVVNGESGMVDKGDPVNIWGDEYDGYKKILVNAGTHGDEKAPCIATMLAIKDLVESIEGWAYFIKSSFKIMICPCLNPYGFHNRTLANYAGVNINRDVYDETQPETKAWKKWIDSNKDAVVYIDVHGVDFFHPFFEIDKKTNEADKKLYATIAAKFASAFFENWNVYIGTSQYPRPYTVVSTYDGLTISYTTDLGMKCIIVETPCDIVSNQYNPAPNYFKSYSKSNKLTKDMLINLIQYFGKLAYSNLEFT